MTEFITIPKLYKNHLKIKKNKMGYFYEYSISGNTIEEVIQNAKEMQKKVKEMIDQF